MAAIGADSPKVMLSYARADYQLAEQIYHGLRGLGVDVWMDVKDLSVAADWWSEIVTTIGSVKAVVLVATRSSLTDSKTVQRELDEARKSRKPIVALVADRRPLPADVEAGFDARRSFERALASIAQHLGAPGADPAGARSRPVISAVQAGFAVVGIAQLVIAAYYAALLFTPIAASAQRRSNDYTFDVAYAQYLPGTVVSFVAAAAVVAASALALAQRRWRVLYLLPLIDPVGYLALVWFWLPGNVAEHRSFADPQVYRLTDAALAVRPYFLVAFVIGLVVMATLATSAAVLRRSLSGSTSPLARLLFLARAPGAKEWRKEWWAAAVDSTDSTDTPGDTPDDTNGHKSTFYIHNATADQGIADSLRRQLVEGGWRPDDAPEFALVLVTNAQTFKAWRDRETNRETPYVGRPVAVLGTSTPDDLDAPELRNHLLDFRRLDLDYGDLTWLGVDKESGIRHDRLFRSAPVNPHVRRLPVDLSVMLLYGGFSALGLGVIGLVDFSVVLRGDGLWLSRALVATCAAVLLATWLAIVVRRRTPNAVVNAMRPLVAAPIVVLAILSYLDPPRPGAFQWVAIGMCAVVTSTVLGSERALLADWLPSAAAPTPSQALALGPGFGRQLLLSPWLYLALSQAPALLGLRPI
jgi:hypothetical protein